MAFWPGLLGQAGVGVRVPNIILKFPMWPQPVGCFAHLLDCSAEGKQKRQSKPALRPKGSHHPKQAWIFVLVLFYGLIVIARWDSSPSNPTISIHLLHDFFGSLLPDASKQGGLVFIKTVVFLGWLNKCGTGWRLSSSLN